MVISANDTTHSRWIREKKGWIKHNKQKSNIELIECGRKANKARVPSLVKMYNCKESFKPGIFQKTILSLERNLDRYDYYVRTNLSTFVITSKLEAFLLKRTRKLFYEGIYCNTDNWVNGWGIILSNDAAKVLVQEGRKRKYYIDHDIADDVLIGKILHKRGIYCRGKNLLGYSWDKKRSFEENIRVIDSNPHTIFIRLQHLDDPALVSALYQIYSK